MGNKERAYIIAVDFDGTLCENKWPEIGDENVAVIAYLKEQKAAGKNLILWTCRTGELLNNAIQWCENLGLIFDAVNENLPEMIESMGGDTRKIFADEYIDDKNKIVQACRSKMGPDSWVENEVKLACQRERRYSGPKEGIWDYGSVCYKSALKAFNSLIEDGHSGFSIRTTKYILDRMIEFKPLTPIEDINGVWNSIYTYEDGTEEFQCKRMSSLFKIVRPNGKIEYHDINRFVGVNISNYNEEFNSSLIDRAMHELYPITMPYMPESNPYRIYCETFITDLKNGDYDTVGLLYWIAPNNEKMRINRFFKEDKNNFVEIDANEYEERRELYHKLIIRMLGKEAGSNESE